VQFYRLAVADCNLLFSKCCKYMLRVAEFCTCSSDSGSKRPNGLRSSDLAPSRISQIYYSQSISYATEVLDLEGDGRDQLGGP
jgi:hypothetical protein